MVLNAPDGAFAKRHIFVSEQGKLKLDYADKQARLSSRMLKRMLVRNTCALSIAQNSLIINSVRPGLNVIKRFLMLNLTEQELYPARKC